MDELYALARSVLFDALDALGSHRDSVVLVGAQAIYVRVGDGDLAAVAPFTTDGDLAVDPRSLKEIPPIENAMLNARFVRKDVGIWLARRPTKAKVDVDVTVDLLAPEVLSPGKGSRNAGLTGHEAGAARKTPGLECALIDHDVIKLTALDEGDTRVHDLRVAGPAALLVSKLKKIADRAAKPKRLKDKDALDVLRLLRGTTTAEVAKRYQVLLANDVAQSLASEGVGLLRDQFGKETSLGVEMAVRATSTLVDEAEVRRSCTLLANDLLAALGGK